MRRRPNLTLNFLGGIEIRENDAPVTGFVTQKALALFVYLAVTRQAHTRDHLAALLWGNVSDTSARGALRYTLWNLRQLLEPYLKISRHTIAFDTDAPHTCDVTAFASAVARLDAIEPPTPQDLENWRNALVLYRGEFLQGFHLRGAEEFDAWLLLARERFHRAVLRVLNKLVAHQTAQQNYARAIVDARRWLELEAWNEDAHRALIRLYALNGDSTAAWAQFETCRRVLAEELNAEPGAATLALMEELRAAATVSPEPALSLKKHNLPVARTPFFGRETEIARIIEKMRDPTCRLLTLTGEGGIGKTRLALEAAAQLTDDFADGVWFVPLSGVEARVQDIPRVLARAVAHALEFAPDPAQDVTRQLTDYLSARTLVLVLDNLEHLLATPEEHARKTKKRESPAGLEVAAWMGELLSHGPHVRVLATSRTRLNLQSEYVLRLNGLEVPPDTQDSGLQDYSCVQLFLERAERAGIAAEDLDRAQIVRLCQLVEGLPLAIELAAAWMNRVAPREMLAAFESNLDRLATTQRDIPARHRSLRAVFENSWRLLSRAEQTVLAQASVFQQRFTRRTAEQIIDTTDTPAASGTRHDTGVSPVLDALVEKSLVRWIARRSAFRLHPLIRQYAQEKLLLLSKENVRQRHAFHFLEYVAGRTAALSGPETHNTIDEIHEALADILAAWDWCVQHRHFEKLNAAQESIAAFYEYAGLAGEGAALFERTVDDLGGDANVARTLVTRLELSQSKLLLRLQRHAEAQTLAERAMVEAKRLDNPELVAWSRYVYAVALARFPDTEAELGELTQARNEAQTMQDKRLEALCEMQRGIVIYRTGNFRGSRDLFIRALHLFQLIQDSRYSALALGLLGVTQYLLGEVPEAVASLERAVEIADILADKIDKGTLLFNLGIVLSGQGQYEKAIEYTKQSEQNFREVGSVRVERCFVYRGFYAAEIGNWAEARHILESYVAARVAGETRREDVWAYWGLSLLARRQGRITDAVRYGHLGLEAAQHWKDTLDQAEVAIALADALVEQGALQEAEENYRAALALRKQMQQTHLYPEAMTGLAGIALQRGEIDAARGWIEKSWYGETLRLAQGPAEPFWIYWTGYQVMRAVNDPRAEQLLETAQGALAEYASQITDPQIRDQFLNVPWHRALLRETATPRALPIFVVSNAA